MKRHTAHGLALAGLLVGGFPLALAAQDSEINVDNTPYVTTSGELLRGLETASAHPRRALPGDRIKGTGHRTSR